LSSCRRLEDILEVKHLDGTPSFAQAHRRARGAKGQGLRYEARVQSHFGRTFGDFYLPGPWFSYRTKFYPNQWNYAQPDGLLFDFERGQLTILEMKYTHTSDAYFQLIDKYLPLMRAFLGTELWSFATCEVVWWYDKAIAFPCPIRLRKEISLVQPNEFAVHICRPS
jgi:hypothetical protein